jgi:hypothetical protein
MGTSASVLDVQSSQPTSADAVQPTVAKAQTKRKASTNTKAQPKRQKYVPIPTPYLAPSSQPEPADAPERTVDPSA